MSSIHIGRKQKKTLVPIFAFVLVMVLSFRYGVEVGREQVLAEGRVFHPSSVLSAVGPDASGEVEIGTPSLSEKAVPEARSPSVRPEGVFVVVRVTDGDTFVVNFDGVDTRVRVIGIDTPETVDPRRPVECFGKEASGRAEELLDGVSVRLELDDTQGERDKYGRILAYAFLPDGTDFGKEMIAGGFAREYTYDAPYRYQAEYRAAEREAKAATRGLWALGTCEGAQ